MNVLDKKIQELFAATNMFYDKGNWVKSSQPTLDFVDKEKRAIVKLLEDEGIAFSVRTEPDTVADPAARVLMHYFAAFEVLSRCSFAFGMPADNVTAWWRLAQSMAKLYLDINTQSKERE